MIMNIELVFFLDFADDHQLLTLLVASFQQERTAAVIVLYKAKQRSEKTLDRFLSFPLVSHPLQIHLDMIRAGFEAKKCLYFSFPLNGFGCPGCCHLVFGAQCWKDFDQKYFIQNDKKLL